ncbi:MAG: tetratricopeptide repeat protein [Candidatus Gastranaerophilales bacterium]|nr:tetratricopeptide repeat protein [Candidatus Gastranaerophilales bacterium]
MKKGWIYLGLVLILLVGLNLINMPLHKGMDNLSQSEFMKLRYGTEQEKLLSYKALYERSEDVYVRKYILEKVARTTHYYMHPKYKTFFLKEVLKTDVPLDAKVIGYYIYDLKYLGRYEDAFKLAMDANIDKTGCHDYNSTILSIVECRVDKIISFYSNSEHDSVKEKLIMDASNKMLQCDVALKRFSSKLLLCDGILLNVESVQNVSNVPGVYLKLGEFYMYKGDYKKALEIFENVLKWVNLEPIDAEYALNELMAECYEKIGDKKSAEKHKKIMQEILSW